MSPVKDVRDPIDLITKVNFLSSIYCLELKKYFQDRKAEFVDKLSAIGGTMGLLTGFSIISGVEIIYFALKIVFRFFKKSNSATKHI